MNTDALQMLATGWRGEAEILRRRGASVQAEVLESVAGELEAAAAAARIEAVSLDEAAELGGYSYSHLQSLVSRDEIENMGQKGSPRIRRCDVPIKPGYGKGQTRSKVDVLDRSLELHRAKAAR